MKTALCDCTRVRDLGEPILSQNAEWWLQGWREQRIQVVYV
jgi:hypothetical protein